MPEERGSIRKLELHKKVQAKLGGYSSFSEDVWSGAHRKKGIP
jgi:hypothetical protein